eukprot:CAMPEP_0115164774 /NCGR_PEP_ID=MMETSP0227-20121206/73217_1 /TAXON_ID=89957 /ORGANISM="Polarella glacialis, Strain CCMP 1383" /LENGTH=298 /DNA_ID=CAMNT_0002577159 /DNA_START=81 /DNA_END=978 /DNA_ORIENTATION=-
MAVSMPPLDLASRMGGVRPHTSQGFSSPMSAREPRESVSAGQSGGAGFQHLTFDSSQQLGEKSAERERLRDKLVDVGQRFVGFDKVIEDDSVRRRLQEVKKFQAAKKEWLGSRKLEQLANDMLERLQKSLLVKIEKIGCSTEDLTRRCAVLEKGIATFRGSLPTKLQVDTAALVKEISELRRIMELDRKSRVDRDTGLLRRLAEMEALEASRFGAGSEELHTVHAKLKEEINVIARTEEAGDDKSEKFRAFILEEIAGMKNTLGQSCQARETTDDEIVQAMNQYTNALAKGLVTANTR